MDSKLVTGGKSWLGVWCWCSHLFRTCTKSICFVFNNTNLQTRDCVWMWMKSSSGHRDPHRIKWGTQTLCIVMGSVCVHVLVYCMCVWARKTPFYPVAVQMLWAGSAATKPQRGGVVQVLHPPPTHTHHIPHQQAHFPPGQLPSLPPLSHLHQPLYHLQIHELHLCQFSPGQERKQQLWILEDWGPQWNSKSLQVLSSQLCLHV